MSIRSEQQTGPGTRRPRGMAHARRRSARRRLTARRAAPIDVVLAVGANVPTTVSSEHQLRTGMPALDHVHSRLLVASPKNPSRVYTILRTGEVDGYDVAMAAPPQAGMLAAVPTGDSFQGTARKAAKLSIASAAMQSFNDVQTLIGSLPADSAMVNLKPPISTAATSNRVTKEKRNVAVKAFLYAASREADNDFHLIIGRDPAKLPERYMTVEVSGLPPKTAASFAKLQAARDAFKAFFGSHLPGMTYDFYDPPVPVRVEGSLFFDMSHATGARPGPPSLKSRMPTIWEVHPVTRLVFEP